MSPRSTHESLMELLSTRPTVSVSQAAQILSISRGQAYAMAHSGELRVIHIGSRLVIPTEHVTSLDEVRDEKVLGRMMAFARDLERERGLAERGYRVVMNTNADGGQTVFHLHLHVLGGRAMRWPPG